MYKCTECGAEYEIKPEYCDCGNNEFVITIDTPVTEEQKAENLSLSDKETVEILKQQYIDTQKKEYTEPIVKEAVLMPFNTVSVVIFIICLILSFVILFLWNPITEQKDINPQKEVVNTNIPAINKIWKDTVPTAETTKEEVKTQIAVTKQEIKIPTVTKPVVQKKPTSTNVTTISKKHTTPIQTKTQTSKTVQKTETQTKQQQKPVQTPQQNIQTTVQNPSPIAQTIVPKSTDIDTAKEKAEFENYKINLRNTIGRKIDFTKVIGDGNCTVAFKIGVDGKLVNRSFEKQSTNMTLNDAVYKAVMATPQFSKPPALYKNETLRLYISFNNGNFSISLK